ncbi:nucleotidyl transferase AbiEii/AbiGii toxin family protein [Candidatus Poriferisodalis sp.]|uniref:nucleotidyl transferase AbiEii/AbiGii toxin family protein n=1 Tax=Candidatus Poriferisodalis sp. TaxID=3101277 RepID=UPI003AF7185C
MNSLGEQPGSGESGIEGPGSDSLENWSDVLDPETRACWPLVAAVTPPSGVLVGGTALAVHLRHRRSRDLDVFVHEVFDSGAILDDLRAIAEVSVMSVADGTLKCQADGVKVQFLHARDQRQIDPPGLIEGLAVGSVRDIAATRYKVIGDRGELRDYFDLMCITVDAGISPSMGLRLYAERYGIGLDHPSVAHVVMALGSFDDVADDPWFAEAAPEASFTTVSSYWCQRQPELAAWLAAALD